MTSRVEWAGTYRTVLHPAFHLARLLAAPRSPANEKVEPDLQCEAYNASVRPSSGARNTGFLLLQYLKAVTCNSAICAPSCIARSEGAARSP